MDDDTGGTGIVSWMTPALFRRSMRALSASALHVRITCVPGAALAILLVNELITGTEAVALATGVSVALGTGVLLGSGVSVWVDVAVGGRGVPVSVAVGVFVGVAVTVGVDVAVGVSVLVGINVSVGVHVAVGVTGVGVSSIANVGNGSSAWGWQAAEITTISRSMIRLRLLSIENSHRGKLEPKNALHYNDYSAIRRLDHQCLYEYAE